MYSQLIKGIPILATNIQGSKGKKCGLDVMIQGYGLKASSTACWLALTILFSHLCLVVGHVGYTTYRRRVSKARSSITDFVVLAQTSPPLQEGAFMGL